MEVPVTPHDAFDMARVSQPGLTPWKGPAMAYPLHWLCTFGGKISNTGREPEIWQCGVRGKAQDGGGHTIGDNDQDVLNHVDQGVRSWWTGPGNMTNAYCTLEWVKLNAIGPDGKYANSETLVSDFTPLPGTRNSSMPSWLSVCFEWRTARGRGPGSHGRIFPPIALDPTPHDVVDGSLQDALLLSAKDLLRGLEVPEGATLSGFAPCVVSQTGVAEPITHAVVGDKIDYISKRRNALHAVYKSVTYP